MSKSGLGMKLGNLVSTCVFGGKGRGVRKDQESTFLRRLWSHTVSGVASGPAGPAGRD